MEVKDSYKVFSENIEANVTIYKKKRDYVETYDVKFPKLEVASAALLDSIRERIVNEVVASTSGVVSEEEEKKVREDFTEKVRKIIKEKIPGISDNDLNVLVGTFVHQFLGLGVLEFMLKDRNVEEIVVNSSKEPVWVYHRKFGWLKTNVTLKSEETVYNYASQIGRKVGLQITNLNPLMDAYLTTGDRVNATIFPISAKGNTLTIRKFARKAWTITDFINAGTISLDTAAFLWLAIQQEMNIIVAGGTASGKTSLLNVLACFIPPTQRIISIEDTRELHLPEFLHWLPMTTRPPNPEGKGEVTMLDLMVNSLRQRPDRIIVGEIRRSREAEVLFEAMNTGHSVYATMHANTAEEAVKRLMNKPIEIPESLISSLHMIAVMHRDRRRGIRRLLEVSEVVPSGTLKEINIELNPVFKWSPVEDRIVEVGSPTRVLEELQMYSGMSEEEFRRDMEKRKRLLKWLVKKNINEVNEVGKVISDFYMGMDPTKGGK